MQEREQLPVESFEPMETVTTFAELLTKIGIPTAKTAHCKHKKGCIEAILIDSLKIGGSSYLIRAGISLLFGIRKIISKPSMFFEIIKSADAIKFSLFMGSFILIFRSILCALRRLVSQEKQKYIPLLAGCIGGFLSSLWLEKSSRQSFGLFLMARAIDITYQSLVRKGVLPEFKYFYVVMYALMMSISGYAYGSEPGSMSPEMNKFYLTFTNETLSDMQMRQIWIERKNNVLAQRGIPRQDPLDYMPKLKKYYESLKAV